MRSAFATALLFAACGPGVPLPDQTTTSRHVHYHHWADEEPCPEALAQLDDQVDFMARTFDLGDVKPVDYYKFRESEEDLSAKACARFGSVGCTVGSVSYGVGWAENHELVHAVWDQLGYPPQMLIEGIAVVLGCGETGYSGFPIPLDLDVESLLDTNTWNASFKTNGAANYAVAGSFVRWLIDLRGPATFTQFYRSAAGMGSAYKAFQDTYSLAFHDAVEAWKASSPGPEGSFCLVPKDPCDAPAMLDASAGRTTLTRGLSCIPQVVTVTAGPNQAIAAGLSSSERPITTVLESCTPQSRLEPVIAPPELFGQSPLTPGKTLELRSFGVGTKGRLRVTPTRNADRLGALLDPQGSAFGGAWGGELTVRTLPSPGALFSGGCPNNPVPVGDDAWSVQLFGDLTEFRGRGIGVVALTSAVPFTVSSVNFGSLKGGLQCGSTCGPACDRAPANDFGLTLLTQARSTSRFRVVLELAH